MSSLRPTLYHYTSVSALHSIVENTCIRMTNAYYLNDSLEIIYAVRHFEKMIAQEIETEFRAKHIGFLKEFKDWIKNLINNAHYIFVFSLSSQRNLLSQWRAYTPHGAGVNIGFEIDSLKRLCDQRGLDLVQCVYTIEERDKVLGELFDQIKAYFEIQFAHLADSYEPKICEFLDFLNGACEKLLKVFCRIKDPTFSEECEWRLVSKYYKYYVDPDIKFRPSETTLIPYIELQLSGMRYDGYLFESVHVGPSPSFNLSFQAISAYLSGKQACKETLSSMSPYRKL